MTFPYSRISIVKGTVRTNLYRQQFYLLQIIIEIIHEPINVPKYVCFFFKFYHAYTLIPMYKFMYLYDKKLPPTKSRPILHTRNNKVKQVSFRCQIHVHFNGPLLITRKTESNLLYALGIPYTTI